jgi:hypothetical protein
MQELRERVARIEGENWVISGCAHTPVSIGTDRRQALRVDASAAVKRQDIQSFIPLTARQMAERRFHFPAELSNKPLAPLRGN